MMEHGQKQKLPAPELEPKRIAGAGAEAALAFDQPQRPDLSRHLLQTIKCIFCLISFLHEMAKYMQFCIFWN